MAAFFTNKLEEIVLIELSYYVTSWLRQPSGTIQYKSRRPFRAQENFARNQHDDCSDDLALILLMIFFLLNHIKNHQMIFSPQNQDLIL